MDDEPHKSIELRFPLVIIRTKRGLDIMERLSRMRVFKAAGWISLFLIPILAASAIFLIGTTVSAYLISPPIREVARGIGPVGALLIPGLNPFLPIIYGWIAIFVGIVVHEGAHGIMARSLNIPVKSAGLMLFLGLPIGAFVEVDDKMMESVSFRHSGRVLAAGSGSNMVTAITALLLMILVVGTMSPIELGTPIAQVYVDLPAQNAGILPGDMILAVNDFPTPNPEDLGIQLANFSPGDEVKITVQRKMETIDYIVRLAEHPQDNSSSFLGVGSLPADVGSILDQYRGALSLSPRMLIYLMFPTGNQILIPFSDTMHHFYTSSLGDAFHPLANLFFWIWFVNFNLGIFNALPIYPLDGGQALRRGLSASLGTKLGEQRIKWITRGVSLTLILLILSVFIIPYVDLLTSI